MKTEKVAIVGMHCNACEELIKDSLMDEEGVTNISIAYKDGYANIAFDETKIDLAKIKHIIHTEGYKTTE